MAVIVNGTEITLTGDVGDFGWGEDHFSHADVVTTLAKIGRETDITIHLNSGGGIATEGAAIHSALKAHKGAVNVVVEGWAASAASLIAMAGDKVNMAKGSVLMIHDPAGISWGAADILRKDAESLDVLADAYAGIYADKCGKKPEEVRTIMKAETWLGPADAVAAKFADAVLNVGDEFEPVKSRMVTAYAHAPQRIVALAKERGWTASRVHAHEDPSSPPRGPAVDTAAIVDLCDSAGHSELASGFIRAKAKTADVRVRLDEVREIGQCADLVGIPASMKAAMIKGGIRLEAARELILDIKASLDEATSSDTAYAGRGQDPRAIDHAAVYSKLNARKD